MEVKNQFSSSCVVLATQSIHDVTTNSSRPVAKFHPSVWGNMTSLLHNPEENMAGEESLTMAQELIHELRRELKEAAKSPNQQLKLIDSIQRLSLDYHFEAEIDQSLLNLFHNYQKFCESNTDLHSIALSFRLLRQQGHRVSCEVFGKFKDEKGDFKACLIDDVAGLLEFYEATFLSVQGEDILDHGRAFARTQLESVLPNLSTPTSEQVFRGVNKFPVRRGLPRLEARHYLSIYEKQSSPLQNLIKLAKLDFNLLQSIHKQELSEVLGWWNGLEFTEKLPYARDRMVECYFWLLGVYSEPEYSLARKISSRVLALVSALDDTYDAYATFQELEIFMEAIERWDFSCLDSLPEYMKVLYTALLKLFDEIEDELIKIDKSYRFAYGKESVKEVARAYFDEAKWLHENYTPTMEEYLSVASISSGYKTMTIVSFLGVGDFATKEAFEWVLSSSDTMKAVLTIARVQHDITSHEFERERNHIPSSVECYMKEYNVSRPEAVVELNKRVEAAWKDINEAFFKPTEIPAPLLWIILNFTRILEVVYKKGDWYTHVGPEMQVYIKQLLIDPIPE